MPFSYERLENGDLRLEVTGDTKHEHTVTIRASDADTVLFALLREHVTSESAFADWLRAQGVEPDVFCWMGE